MNITVLVVDIHNSEILPPVQLRAELDWTVGMLKSEICKVTMQNTSSTPSLYILYVGMLYGPRCN